MKKYIILLMFNFLLSFGNDFPIEENLFEDIYIENTSKQDIKKLKITQGVKISNLNPVSINDSYSKRIINFVYDTLFFKDEKGNIQSRLLKNYNWINNKELYLELKNNICFHNGDLLNSYDVKTSLEQLKNSNLKYLFSGIMRIKILDNNKLLIELSEEDNTFLEKLTYGITSIVKIKNEKIYGTGQYYIKSFQNDSIILKRNDNYYDKNKVLIEELEFSYDIQDKQRLISLFNDEIDVALDIDQNALNYGKDYEIIDDDNFILEEKSFKTLALIFGNKYKYSRENKEVMNNIIEREAISFFPQNSLNLKEYKNDSTNISSSQLKNMKKKIDLMILNTDKNIEIANQMKKSFEKFGIELNILPHNLESYNQKCKDKDFDVALFDILMISDDTIFNIAKVFLNDLENYEIYNSLLPFFKLLKQEKRADRREIIQIKILDLINKELPYIPIKHYKNYMVVSSDLKNIIKGW